MAYSEIQQSILAIDSRTAMKAAVDLGVFYVVALPTMNGYSIGTMSDNKGNEAPALYATKNEAMLDLVADAEAFKTQIEEGERDADDVFEFEVLEARWDGHSEMMELYDEGGNWLHTEQWKSMAGL